MYFSCLLYLSYKVSERGIPYLVRIPNGKLGAMVSWGYVFKYRISIGVSRLSPSFLRIWNVLGVVFTPRFWIILYYGRFPGIFLCTLRIYLIHFIIYIFWPFSHDSWRGLVFISSLDYIIHQILISVLLTIHVRLLNIKWSCSDPFICIMF